MARSGVANRDLRTLYGSWGEMKMMVSIFEYLRRVCQRCLVCAEISFSVAVSEMMFQDILEWQLHKETAIPTVHLVL